MLCTDPNLFQSTLLPCYSIYFFRVELTASSKPPSKGKSDLHMAYRQAGNQNFDEEALELFVQKRVYYVACRTNCCIFSVSHIGYGGRAQRCWKSFLFTRKILNTFKSLQIWVSFPTDLAKGPLVFLTPGRTTAYRYLAYYIKEIWCADAVLDLRYLLAKGNC